MAIWSSYSTNKQIRILDARLGVAYLSLMLLFSLYLVWSVVEGYGWDRAQVEMDGTFQFEELRTYNNLTRTAKDLDCWPGVTGEISLPANCLEFFFGEDGYSSGLRHSADPKKE